MGWCLSTPQQASPTLSYFVVDEVHDEIVLTAAVSGTPNTTVEFEFFVAYDDGVVETEEGAAFCDDANVQLNGSGQGGILISFDRNVVFDASAIGGPFSFAIDFEDRIVATASDSNNAGTSEFSAASHPTLPGDFNLDGNVDGADFVVWAKFNGATNAVYTQGDADFDGNVDSDDYDIWFANYGDTP
jgi:hypothetical protein